MPRLCVTMTVPVRDKIEALAEKEGRTLSYMTAVLIEEAIKSREKGK